MLFSELNESTTKCFQDHMLLTLLTKNLKLSDQQLGYRNQSSCTYTVTILEGIIMQYNKKNSNVHRATMALLKAFD